MYKRGLNDSQLKFGEVFAVEKLISHCDKGPSNKIISKSGIHSWPERELSDREIINWMATGRKKKKKAGGNDSICTIGESQRA
jgi:hypothetical protein